MIHLNYLEIKYHKVLFPEPLNTISKGFYLENQQMTFNYLSKYNKKNKLLFFKKYQNDSFIIKFADLENEIIKTYLTYPNGNFKHLTEISVPGENNIFENRLFNLYFKRR